MMSSEQGFVARWSRRKSAERSRAAANGASGGEPASERRTERADAASSAVAPTGPVDAASDPPAPMELPSLDSLTKDSDFAPFLRHGVPEEMKHAALRKLWTSDPVWALPERLDLHNLDYTFPTVPQLVETAYRVGQGFLDATAEPAEPAPAPMAVASGPATAPVGGESSPALKDQTVTRRDDTLIDQPPPVGCNDADESPR
jgi:Protein of unknown function (DUF3306)